MACCTNCSQNPPWPPYCPRPTIGRTGLDGEKGHRGRDGPQGVTPMDGPQGFQGSVGVDGPNGFQGFIGLQGFSTAFGNQGERGPQGDLVVGMQGLQGPQGETYPFIGIQGPSGEMGPQGPDGRGTQGPQGPSALFLVGPQGETLPSKDGFQGQQGFPGENGPIGMQGETGPQGAIGPQGFFGAQGPDGVSLVLGLQGSQGFMGIGTQGLSGPQGDMTIGPQGPQGSQGGSGVSTGPQGLPNALVRGRTVFNAGPITNSGVLVSKIAPQTGSGKFVIMYYVTCRNTSVATVTATFAIRVNGIPIQTRSVDMIRGPGASLPIKSFTSFALTNLNVNDFVDVILNSSGGSLECENSNLQLIELS